MLSAPVGAAGGAGAASTAGAGAAGAGAPAEFPPLVLPVVVPVEVPPVPFVEPFEVPCSGVVVLLVPGVVVFAVVVPAGLVAATTWPGVVTGLAVGPTPNAPEARNIVPAVMRPRAELRPTTSPRTLPVLSFVCVVLVSVMFIFYGTFYRSAS